jgi:hypothetical protein
MSAFLVRIETNKVENIVKYGFDMPFATATGYSTTIDIKSLPAISDRKASNFIVERVYLSSAILLPLCFNATCAAARRATGTRNGEQET